MDYLKTSKSTFTGTFLGEGYVYEDGTHLACFRSSRTRLFVECTEPIGINKGTVCHVQGKRNFRHIYHGAYKTPRTNIVNISELGKSRLSV